MRRGRRGVGLEEGGVTGGRRLGYREVRMTLSCLGGAVKPGMVGVSGIFVRLLGRIMVIEVFGSSGTVLPLP